MLACRTTQTLLRAPRRILAQPLACYSNKADIPKDNMFWMKHQIEAKPGFHSHINQVKMTGKMVFFGKNRPSVFYLFTRSYVFLNKPLSNPVKCKFSIDMG